jgi:hypothetical protein
MAGERSTDSIPLKDLKLIANRTMLQCKKCVGDLEGRRRRVPHLRSVRGVNEGALTGGTLVNHDDRAYSADVIKMLLPIRAFCRRLGCVAETDEGDEPNNG